MHPVIRYLLVAIPLCVMAFLAMSGLLNHWEGRVVSRRPVSDETLPTVPVLVVSDDGSYRELGWPRAVVDLLPLKEDRSGLPPIKVPEDAPRTLKLRGTMTFIVTTVDGKSQTVATTSPRALGISLLLLAVGFLVHNAYQSGSPLRWSPRTPDELAAQTNTGLIPGTAPPPPPPAPTPVAQRPRGQHGPPPRKPRSGWGRR